jgi:hypothetical protein
MCLKHATGEEVLQELERRINNGEIKWNITYFFNTDNNRVELQAQRETEDKVHNYSLFLETRCLIERNYFCRQVYKKYESTFKKIIAKDDEKLRKKRSKDKLMETLKVILRKKLIKPIKK